jgi:transposase
MGRNSDVDVSCTEGPAKRRYRTKQERRRIAEESLQPGTSVAVLARRHEVNANQVFHWRKLLREDRLEIQPATAQLLPVRIAEDRPGPIPPQPGTIHLEFRQVRIRVEGAVDVATLRVILEHLGR